MHAASEDTALRGKQLAAAKKSQEAAELRQSEAEDKLQGFKSATRNAQSVAADAEAAARVVLSGADKMKMLKKETEELAEALQAAKQDHTDAETGAAQAKQNLTDLKKRRKVAEDEAAATQKQASNMVSEEGQMNVETSKSKAEAQEMGVELKQSQLSNQAAKAAEAAAEGSLIAADKQAADDTKKLNQAANALPEAEKEKIFWQKKAAEGQKESQAAHAQEQDALKEEQAAMEKQGHLAEQSAKFEAESKKQLENAMVFQKALDEATDARATADSELKAAEVNKADIEQQVEVSTAAKVVAEKEAKDAMDVMVAAKKELHRASENKEIPLKDAQKAQAKADKANELADKALAKKEAAEKVANEAEAELAKRVATLHEAEQANNDAIARTEQLKNDLEASKISAANSEKAKREAGEEAWAAAEKIKLLEEHMLAVENGEGGGGGTIKKWEITAKIAEKSVLRSRQADQEARASIINAKNLVEHAKEAQAAVDITKNGLVQYEADRKAEGMKQINQMKKNQEEMKQRAEDAKKADAMSEKIAQDAAKEQAAAKQREEEEAALLDSEEDEEKQEEAQEGAEQNAVTELENQEQTANAALLETQGQMLTEGQALDKVNQELQELEQPDRKNLKESQDPDAEPSESESESKSEPEEIDEKTEEQIINLKEQQESIQLDLQKAKEKELQEKKDKEEAAMLVTAAKAEGVKMALEHEQKAGEAAAKQDEVVTERETTLGAAQGKLEETKKMEVSDKANLAEGKQRQMELKGGVDLANQAEMNASKYVAQQEARLLAAQGNVTSAEEGVRNSEEAAATATQDQEAARTEGKMQEQALAKVLDMESEEYSEKEKMVEVGKEEFEKLGEEVAKKEQAVQDAKSTLKDYLTSQTDATNQHIEAKTELLAAQDYAKQLKTECDKDGLQFDGIAATAENSARQTSAMEASVQRVAGSVDIAKAEAAVAHELVKLRKAHSELARRQSVVTQLSEARLTAQEHEGEADLKVKEEETMLPGLEAMLAQAKSEVELAHADLVKAESKLKEQLAKQQSAKTKEDGAVTKLEAASSEGERQIYSQMVTRFKGEYKRARNKAESAQKVRLADAEASSEIQSEELQLKAEVESTNEQIVLANAGLEAATEVVDDLTVKRSDAKGDMHAVGEQAAIQEAEVAAAEENVVMVERVVFEKSMDRTKKSEAAAKKTQEKQRHLLKTVFADEVAETEAALAKARLIEMVTQAALMDQQETTVAAKEEAAKQKAVSDAAAGKLAENEGKLANEEDAASLAEGSRNVAHARLQMVQSIASEVDAGEDLGEDAEMTPAQAAAALALAKANLQNSEDAKVSSACVVCVCTDQIVVVRRKQLTRL